mmetsp:Transcript_31188/g.75424  ORF Transcript_31188/g.75424 Transcript_31188/m.75424 type:complete len:144 (+) Transcript_31188:156-587(+)
MTMKNSKAQIRSVLLSGLIAEAAAFLPPSDTRSNHRSASSKCQKTTTTAICNTLAYEDWHGCSLHPLDELGVVEGDDDDGDYLYGSALVEWGAVNARAPLEVERSADDPTTMMVEMATAFLPVAMLILFEISYAGLSDQQALL